MSGEQVVEGAAHAAPTAGEYIKHHLQPLQLNFSLEPVKQTKMVDFTLFNVDSVFFSAILGALVCLILWWAAKRATSGVPGRFQAAIEILVEFVEGQAKGLIHNKESLKAVSPMALTVFLWILFMNAMDMIPVDLLPWMWGHAYEAAGYDAAHAYLRVLPTADLSATFGMSFGVLLVTVYYNIKIKGLGGWGHELISAPFGDHIAIAPINLMMQAIEFGSKTISHGMRLFGNMFAGELVFMLIAMLGGAWAGFSSPLSWGLGIAHLAAGSIWAIFHILVITLQAYIFMMLTLIYVSQAHSKH